MTTFKIPEFNVYSFKAAIAKLNRVCVKLNKPEVTVVKTGNETKIITKNEADEYSPTGFSEKKYSIELTVFEVDGVAPQIDGWSFRSLINVEDGDKYIKSVPGFNLPEEFRTREVCDHCKINRKRNSYFFVANEANELKQVGSSCVKDFLGHSNPATIAAWFELINTLGEFAEYDEENNSVRSRPVYDLDTAIQVTMELIKKNGFVSRKKADETNVEPTSGWIFSFLIACANGKEKSPVIDNEAIAAFIEWFNGQEDREGSDYVYNVKQTINNESGHIAPRKFGVLAAAVNSWMRHNTESENTIPSEFFGAVGDKKVELELTVWNVFVFSGDYGTVYTNIFKDAQSRVFIWKTSKGFDKGAVVKLVGTIKGHEDYKNIKQTIMTRCKVI